MKLVKHEDYRHPPNVVKFEVHLNMSKFDIKNYLEKIYNVPVACICTRIKDGGYGQLYNGNPVRRPDIKFAYITLGLNQTFQFPKIEDKDKTQPKELEGQKEVEEELKKFDSNIQKKIQNKPNIPLWFGI
ncbi:large ribosomal subunit protein uL23m-like isoform X2 [Gordionus sp. m RMFG-2023]